MSINPLSSQSFISNFKVVVPVFVALAMMSSLPSHAAFLINPVEFIEDDQAGFDLWSGGSFNGTTSATANFTTDPGLTTGTTTVTITASSNLTFATNRTGSVDGTPTGYSYQRLYEDLVAAQGATEFLTIDVSGLNVGTSYLFTLYAWDPQSTDNNDKVWSVTGGTGVPSSDMVNYQDSLIDNDTFAMDFTITADGSGAFQLTNTAGLAQSAINGFSLAAAIPEPSSFALLASALSALALLRRRRRF